jgi:hypothetical protein
VGLRDKIRQSYEVPFRNIGLAHNTIQLQFLYHIQNIDNALLSGNPLGDDNIHSYSSSFSVHDALAG